MRVQGRIAAPDTTHVVLSITTTAGEWRQLAKAAEKGGFGLLSQMILSVLERTLSQIDEEHEGVTSL